MNPPRPQPAPPPFPDVRSAFLLTIGAILVGGLVGVFFFDLGPLVAEGLGTALGIGGVATLAARRVAEPQATRIGFAPLPWRAWPLILALVPAVLLASELDNLAYDASPAETAAGAANAAEDAPPEDAAEPAAKVGTTAIAEAVAEAAAKAEPPPPIVDPDDPFSLMEAFIVVVGIAPVIHEFFFRGVIQQGLVTQLGLMRGVTLASLLWTMLRPPGVTSLPRFAAAFAAWFALGWLLGMVRVASGSILGSILLASLWAAVGFASLALQGRVDLPGMNVDGTHLPVAVTLASLALVAWAARRVFEEAKRRTG